MEDFNLEEFLNSEEGVTHKVNVKEQSKGKVSGGRITACVLIGLGISFLIFLMVGVLYTNFIRFPAQEEIIAEQTGIYALENYEKAVHDQKSVFDNSDYLTKEITYANSNKHKLSFISKIVNTVHYESKSVSAKNIFGNDMIDSKTLEVVDMTSPVEEGEEVFFTYVNYNAINFDEETLKKLIKDYDLTADNVDYANIAVDMFCDYISGMKTIPKIQVSRVPGLKKTGNKYTVVQDEDIYLDKLLFSSDAFKKCEMRFTEALGKLLSDKGSFKPSDEWINWNKLPKIEKEETAEPFKYGKMTMSMNWCGAYYLQNDYYGTDEDGNIVKDKITPQLGDGSFDSPASIGTPAISYVLSNDKDGKLIKDPIRVEMTEYGCSEDAINWFQGKDVQNRGFTLDSEAQYCYYVFKITNLSNKTLVVNDNASLCDKNGNISTKTGTIYGLSESIELKPDESGVIESWGRSTELNLKYVIWGKDFSKQQNPVWFRVLAGNKEDTSEDKGVYIINRRQKETSVPETTVATSISKEN